MRHTYASLALIMMVGCGDSGGTTAAGTLFSPAITDLVIEVDYAPNAAPYVGNEALFGDVWELTRTNIAALFAAAPKTLTIDDELAKMDALAAAPGGPDYTVDEILAIADDERSVHDTATARSFYVVFLDGYFADNDGRQDQVLGVSLGQSGVIAMFKPVIDSAGLTKRRVEQTTLVHELGHAFGLVDNGLPPVDPTHHDSAHGAHCANEDCIMYWQNEVGASLGGFIASRVTSSRSVLFDQDCLDDAAAAAERAR